MSSNSSSAEVSHGSDDNAEMDPQKLLDNVEENKEPTPKSFAPSFPMQTLAPDLW